MSTESLNRSRTRAFLVFSISFLLFSIQRMEVYQTAISPYKGATLFMDCAVLGFYAFGFYLMYRFSKRVKSTDESIRNALKDELASFEMSYSIKLSYYCIMLTLLLLSLVGTLGLSGSDIVILLFGLGFAMPLLVFAFRDKFYG